MAIVERVVGTVERYNSFNGKGLISLTDGREAVVHYAAIRGDGIRSLDVGAAVSCQVEETRYGLKAVCVEVM